MLIKDIIIYKTKIARIKNRKKFSFITHFVFVLTVLFYSNNFAQWVNSPKQNTKVVINSFNPINISSVKDFNGGTFIFWQDKKLNKPNQVYFVHLDSEGKITFNAEGKDVSLLDGKKLFPVSTENLPGTAVVLWKDYSNSKTGELYVQRVSESGNYLWSLNGIKLTDSTHKSNEYSIASNKKGTVFVSYIAKKYIQGSNFKVELQKITSGGNLVFDTTRTVFKSKTQKNSTELIPDDSGGTYIAWLDNIKNKSIIYLQHVNKNGFVDWNKTPLLISGDNNYVISYNIKKFTSKRICIAWQVLGNDKDIYYQIIDRKGKEILDTGGKIISNRSGNQVNPQIAASDSTFYISWTSDYKNSRDIFVQKFDRNGNPLWKESGISVIGLNGAQFGQRIISDNKNVILSWIDRRQNSERANIYAQKISGNGIRLWDSLGVAVAIHQNTSKSYLSLITDENDGAIVIFKEKRDSISSIFAQRIFESGTFASQIINFKAKISADSVTLKWNTLNEQKNAVYHVQRSEQTNSNKIHWKTISTIKPFQKRNSENYLYIDHPETSGTLFYRIIEGDPTGIRAASEIEKVNYFSNSIRPMLAQNIPNPFSDSTKISFFIPQKKNVILEFFNSQIEKISELKRTFPAGQNQITFLAKGLSPGIYFYRLKTKDFVDVKKMVITR